MTDPQPSKTTKPPKCTVCGEVGHTAGFHDSSPSEGAEPMGFHDSAAPTDAGGTDK
jgi:hypothetical protein